MTYAIMLITLCLPLLRPVCLRPSPCIVAALVCESGLTFCRPSLHAVKNKRAFHMLLQCDLAKDDVERKFVDCRKKAQSWFNNQTLPVLLKKD